MKGVLYYVKNADHSKYHTVQDYLDAFNEGSDILYKSIFFQNLTPEKKQIINEAWKLYNEQRYNEIREIEALQREEAKYADKPYPSISSIIKDIQEDPDRINYYTELLEYDSTCMEYRANIRKAIWYTKNKE